MKTPTKGFLVRLPSAEYDSLREYAALTGRSMNAEVVTAVRIHVREHALRRFDFDDQTRALIERQLETLRDQAFGDDKLPEGARHWDRP